MPGDVWVLAEGSEGRLEGITYELITKGREIADVIQAQLTAVILGHRLEACVNLLSSSGVDRVLFGDSPLLEPFNPEGFVRVLLDGVKNHNPSFILAGHTYVGMDVAPALATRLGASLASNCLDVQVEGQRRITVTRPMYNGKIHAKASLEATEPTLITFQKGAVEAKNVEPKQDVEIKPLPVALSEADLRVKVVGVTQLEAGEVDISKAEIIVAGGRGLGEPENFQLIKDLAAALGGSYACSRPLVDMGWLPSAYQVGLSGKTVKPRLYVAVGISGASQHLVGMKDSEVVVAINKDPNAPIFEVADYGIVGDLFEVVPKLIEELKKAKDQ